MRGHAKSARAWQVTADDRSWEVQRRYSDFHELNLRLAKAFGEATLPELPPKLLMNADENIAERRGSPSHGEKGGTHALERQGFTQSLAPRQVPGAGCVPAHATAGGLAHHACPPTLPAMSARDFVSSVLA